MTRQLDTLYKKYLEAENRWSDSVKFNDNGSDVRSSSKGLKSAATRAHSNFMKYAESIGMELSEIISFQMNYKK